ncbi:MAG: lipopolysaccharide core heptose(I) kinase RfaP, partial [Akkermansiaceae bacterium]
VGKGTRGSNPAKRESFVIMEALDERVEVENFLKDIGGLTDLTRKARWRLRKEIIKTVAQAAKKMHGAGMNHRDFYLCHFHIAERDWQQWAGEVLRLPLLDLHRAQIRSKVPRRWLVKDLGALYFSALDAELTNRDVVTFLREYLGADWRKRCRENLAFWQAVSARAASFYQKHRQKPAPLPAAVANFS